MVKTIKHLILDMDGVLWRGETPRPKLPDFFAGLKNNGIQFAFATNNASKTPAEYVAKFDRFGVAIDPAQVMTSALATAAHLARTIPQPGPVYVVGGRGLREAIAEKGFTLVDRFDSATSAAAVAVGFAQDVVYDDFATATAQIRQHNARFFGSNPDVTFPSETGLKPGNGSFLALLEAATGSKPEIVGKPFTPMFNACLDFFGPSATGHNTAVVGDRLNTDIRGGLDAGLQTILVFSGVTQPADLAASPYKPDFVFDDISALLENLPALNGRARTKELSDE